MAEDLSSKERELLANLIRDGKPIPARYIPSISESPLEVELVWPGKSPEFSRVVLPFQSIEHIDEPRKGTATQWDLFSVSEFTGRQSGGWTNKLIWGDNSLILSSLAFGPMKKEVEEAGGLKLVYIDPPFDVGADFSMDIEVGGDSVTKNPSVIEEVAYRDTWGRGADSFLSMLHTRLKLIEQLMTKDSSILVHVDWRMNSAVRLLMDEVFGIDNYRNEIAWCYSGPASTKVHLPRKHDLILFYVKGSPFFSQPRVPHKSGVHNTGQVFGASSDSASEEKQREMETRGKALEDWWDDIYTTDRYRSELVGYPTQKPENLLNRIVQMTTQPGDLVADFFCGSGTTLAVAEKLGRKWIGADLGRFAIHTSRKRLISVQREAGNQGGAYRAFEILNLGGYERTHLVGIDVVDDNDAREMLASARRESFIELILSAYGAQRSDQLAPFSGSKSGTAIFVGAVDSAVTQDQVQEAIDVALEVGLPRIDVLGFEFEMGISPAMSDAAKEMGLTLTLRYIPNEVFDKRAISKNQVKFYEVGYVEAKFEVVARKLRVSLTDFGVFYRQDDADETAIALKNGGSKVVVDQGQVVRVAKSKTGIVTKENLTSNWYEWIDYWAIDFDFASQPELIRIVENGKEIRKRTGRFIFENEWQSFREKKDRALELTSAPFEFAEAGTYSVAVKVIDIFGNDTTRVFKVKVK